MGVLMAFSDDLDLGTVADITGRPSGHSPGGAIKYLHIGTHW
jgi:hypothetical protein